MSASPTTQDYYDRFAPTYEDARHDGEPVYDSVNEVSQATWKLDRLMRDDAHWEHMSQRCQAFYEGTHSVDAVIDRYEREILALHES